MSHPSEAWHPESGGHCASSGLGGNHGCRCRIIHCTWKTHHLPAVWVPVGPSACAIRYAAQEVRQWGREEVSLHVDYPCESAQAAETQQHRLGSFNNRGLFARRCGCCESEVRVPARWGSARALFPSRCALVCPFPSSCKAALLSD